MNDLDLEALSKLEIESTTAPWTDLDTVEDHYPIRHIRFGIPANAPADWDGHDPEFVVALRNAARSLLEKAKRLGELESALEWLACCIDDWTIQNESTTAEKSFHAVNDEVTKWHDAPTVTGAVCGLAKQYGWSPKGQGE